jgi:hypothetical protein
VNTPITFEQVRDYLCQEWRIPSAGLEPASRLLHDLGIDADDAEVILEGFGKQFGVDLSAFPFRRHFGSEAGAGARWAVRKIFGGDAVRLAPVTVQDLIDAASQGRWIEHE